MRLTNRKERLIRSDSFAILNHRCATCAEKNQRDIPPVAIFWPPDAGSSQGSWVYVKSFNTIPAHQAHVSSFSGTRGLVVSSDRYGGPEASFCALPGKGPRSPQLSADGLQLAVNGLLS